MTMPYRPNDQQLESMLSQEGGSPSLRPDQPAVEAEIIGAAEDLDTERDAAVDNMAPTGQFSVEALNDLVDSLNAVLPMFGEDQSYPSFSDGIDGPLPTEFVSALAMVADAARSAGLERLAPDLENMGDDGGLDKAARMLDTLAGDQSFKTFLRTSVTQPARETPAPAPEAAPPAAPPSGDMDALLQSRA
tara:strand:+ start:11124 stop:11693 length:570 start_codon:yes stop_codon:yes gene_type:complete